MKLKGEILREVPQASDIRISYGSLELSNLDGLS